MHDEQTDREIARRRAMVEAVRRGQSQQQVARDFGVSPGTVNRWVRHAQGQRLDRVDWSDRPRVPYTIQRTEAGIEDLVLEVRHQVQVESDSWMASYTMPIPPLPTSRRMRYSP